MEDEYDVQCPRCGSCGEDGCCSALICAKKNMVGGQYCESNFKEIEFWYKLGKRLYDKSPDESVFDEVYDEVFRKD